MTHFSSHLHKKSPRKFPSESILSLLHFSMVGWQPTIVPILPVNISGGIDKLAFYSLKTDSLHSHM